MGQWVNIYIVSRLSGDMVQQSNQTYFVRDGDDLYTYVDGEKFLETISVAVQDEGTLCVDGEQLCGVNGEPLTLRDVVGCVDQQFDKTDSGNGGCGVETGTGYWLIQNDNDAIDSYISFVCETVQ